MTNEEVDKVASGIAALLLQTDTDWRGNALYFAGKKLKDASQGYTGELLQNIGNEYGIK